MAAPNEITPQHLLHLIGTSNCPQIIDISINPDFTDDLHLIPGASRHPHNGLQGLFTRLNGQPLVIICQKGIELSQSKAARLRRVVLRSEYLSGGNYGRCNLPQAPRTLSANSPLMEQGHSLWITRHRPKTGPIDRPWLIRRFIDKNPHFLFVSTTEVIRISERYNAIPFDTEDVFWNHHGQTCTFDTMLHEFGLRNPALDRLSIVVRTAAPDNHDLASEAAGLFALSVELSRQYRGDIELLDAGMNLYDALYRWARYGTAERHTWPTGKPS